MTLLSRLTTAERGGVELDAEMIERMARAIHTGRNDATAALSALLRALKPGDPR